MGFLAYLLVGGIVGWAAGRYFPGFSPKSKTLGRVKQHKSILLWTIGLGVLGAATASYGGQMMGLFTSGQMQEWGSAIIGSFLLVSLYFLLKG